MDFKKAVLDPASSFSRPYDVLEVVSLSREQKIKILQQWEYDARELEVATEEGMPQDKRSLLEDVHKALHSLDADVDLEHVPPTKQG